MGIYLHKYYPAKISNKHFSLTLGEMLKSDNLKNPMKCILHLGVGNEEGKIFKFTEAIMPTIKDDK